MALQRPKVTSHQPMSRREVLRAGLERLAQQRELREHPVRAQTNALSKKGGAAHSNRTKADFITKVWRNTKGNMLKHMKSVLYYLNGGYMMTIM